MNNLLQILLFERGVDASLVEFNKAISLSGITLLCIAFIVPRGFELKSPLQYQNTLYSHAQLMLVIHSIYSLFKYYGSKNIPKLKEWKVPFWSDLLHKRSQMEGVKKLSIILGNVSQLALFMGYSSLLNKNFAMVLAILLGTAHFYLMEVDYKFQLQVRPFAFLPFPLAGIALVFYFWGIPNL